jgi:hypothetical protein
VIGMGHQQAVHGRRAADVPPLLTKAEVGHADSLPLGEIDFLPALVIVRLLKHKRN